MQTTTRDGKSFVLRAESELDQRLIDALFLNNEVSIVHTARQPGPVTTATLLVDDASGCARLARTSREALGTLGQLLSLGLIEAARHGHVAGPAIDPQPQEQLAPTLEQLQFMTDALGAVVRQANVQCRVSTHENSLKTKGVILTNEIAALRHRAVTGLLFTAAHPLTNQAERFEFFRGHLDALACLKDGAGAFVAARDAANSGYEPPTYLKAAIAALPKDLERLCLAEVKQFLAAQGVEVAGDAVADGGPGMSAQATTTLLETSRRLDACDDLVGNETGIGASTVGVDLQPLGFAPFGEIVRVQVNADYAPAFCLESFAASFGCSQPLIVGPMEFVAILKHGSQPDVVLALEPDHAGSPNGSHTASSEVTGALIVAQGGAA